MKDKYTSGLLAGLAGGIAATPVNLLLIYLFKIGSLRFVDFAGTFVFGHFPRGFWEFVVTYLVYLGFSATLGVVFTYLTSFAPNPRFLIKGIHFGAGIWFFSYAITLLFKIPRLKTVSLGSAVTNFLASMTYGLVVALTLQWLLKQRQGLK
ncbi:MAG TPA: hypothetical protein DDW93_09095 [Firmicutes bacterium]|nr:hypothetical protein [Bacillota bacterium]HBK68746.1 hypothetical protein [Bacillota bacterium]HBT18222.1 hypothetical protein [Bacillota bacterium]